MHNIPDIYYDSIYNYCMFLFIYKILYRLDIAPGSVLRVQGVNETWLNGPYMSCKWSENFFLKLNPDGTTFKFGELSRVLYNQPEGLAFAAIWRNRNQWYSGALLHYMNGIVFQNFS